MRIQVVVSEEEYATIKAKAELVPLSTWIKSVVLREFAAMSPEAISQIEKARNAGVTNQTLRDAEERMESEVREPEDVRRDRDVPASRRRTAAPERTSRKAAKPKSKRGRRGDDEAQDSRKCEAPVGSGIWCPSCGRRH